MSALPDIDEDFDAEREIPLAEILAEVGLSESQVAAVETRIELEVIERADQRGAITRGQVGTARCGQIGIGNDAQRRAGFGRGRVANTAGQRDCQGKQGNRSTHTGEGSA